MKRVEVDFSTTVRGGLVRASLLRFPDQQAVRGEQVEAFDDDEGLSFTGWRIGIDTATAAGSQLPAPVARLGDLDRACNHCRHHRLSRKVDRSLGSGHGDSPHPRGEVADLVGLGCTISSWGAGVPDTRAGVDRAGARGDGELIPFVAGR
jgi:hypothetical protein